MIRKNHSRKSKSIKNSVLNLIAGIAIGGCVFSLPQIYAENNDGLKKSEELVAVNQKEETLQVKPMYSNFYFEGELVETSNKAGYYQYGGNYLPSSLVYKNAVYVPIDFITKNTDYSLIYEREDIYLSPLKDYGYSDDPTSWEGEDPVSVKQDKVKNNNQEEADYSPPIDEYQDDISSKSKISVNDLTFFNIDPYDDIESALGKLNFKNQKIMNSDSDVFVTDSVGTDTSFYMNLELDSDNRITRMDYEDFSVKFKKINQKYKYKQQTFKSNKGIILGSKVTDVLKLYGEPTNVNIGEIDQELDYNGKSTVNNMIKSFSPYFDESLITFDMRQKAIPKNAPQNKLLYLTITYQFEGETSGYLSYYAVVGKNESIKNAAIYGFDYNLY